MRDRPELAFRYFVFEPNGTLKRAAKRSLGNLLNGTEALPQFIGLKLRYVVILIEMKNKRPIRIYSLEPRFFTINSAGGIDLPVPVPDSALVHAAKAVQAVDRRARVVPLVPMIEWKRLASPSQWTPTKTQLAQIIGAIWPEHRAANVPAPSYIRTVPAGSAT